MIGPAAMTKMAALNAPRPAWAAVKHSDPNDVVPRGISTRGPADWKQGGRTASTREITIPTAPPRTKNRATRATPW